MILKNLKIEEANNFKIFQDQNDEEGKVVTPISSVFARFMSSIGFGHMNFLKSLLRVFLNSGKLDLNNSFKLDAAQWVFRILSMQYFSFEFQFQNQILPKFGAGFKMRS